MLLNNVYRHFSATSYRESSIMATDNYMLGLLWGMTTANKQTRLSYMPAIFPHVNTKWNRSRTQNIFITTSAVPDFKLKLYTTTTNCQLSRNVLSSPVATEMLHSHFATKCSQWATFYSNNTHICIMPNCHDFRGIRHTVNNLPSHYRLVAWHSGRMLLFGRWTFPVARLTFDWWVTTYESKPSVGSQTTRSPLPFILLGSINE